MTETIDLQWFSFWVKKGSGKKKRGNHVLDGLEAHNLQGGDRLFQALPVGGRHEQGPEPRHSASRSRQAHLTADRGVQGDRLFVEAGEQGHHHPEVNGRLVNADAAGDIEKDVVVEEGDAELFLQHRGEQGQALGVGADGRAPGGAQACRADQGLHLHQDGPGAPDARQDHRAGDVHRPLRRNRAAGFATSARPLSFISKTPISLVEPKRFLTVRRIRNT